MVKTVAFTQLFQKKLAGLDKTLKERLKRKVHELAAMPTRGKPLKLDLKGSRSIRVGPFRIVYELEGDTLKLLDFDHRKKVYR